MRASLVGRSRSELPTPALVLDLEAMRQNIATMAQWSRSHVSIRPHFKTHKSVAIAREQVAAGAIGVTAATVWEAQALVKAGIDEILVANEVVTPDRAALLAGLACERNVTLAVDDTEVAETVSAAASSVGCVLGALVDTDVGLHRGGVRTPEAARALAERIALLPGLRFRGVMGYEGHVVTEPDRERRREGAARAMDELAVYAETLRGDGHPVEIVSAGGTNTHDMTGADARVTELQAGTYVVMDAAYAPLAPVFRTALTVVSTVVSRQGGTAVLDCGTKAMAVDAGMPLSRSGTVREVHEEHTLLDVAAGAPPGIGDVVEMVVGYCGGTINLHDVYFVASGEEIVDIWPISARGPGWTRGLWG